MKIVPLLLFLLLCILQAQYWFGEGSRAEQARLQERVNEMELQNRALTAQNEVLTEEVIDLKSGMDAVEELARRELGLIKPDETFILLLERPSARQSVVENN